MNRYTKIVIIAVVILIVLGLIFSFSINKEEKEDDGKINIVVTTFSCYDFSKQIINEKANIIFLLGPGVDSHSYEPSTGDLAKIKNADIFVYVGGEMEKWVEKILETDTIDTSKTRLIKVTDAVETIKEIEVDGAEEEEDEEDEVEGAFDEHIWTSPENAIEIVKYLGKKYGEIDIDNAKEYETNANNYAEEIKIVQTRIWEIVNNKKRDRLVFGDKMPMQYFLNEFGLTASAAFNGCSTETEPGTKTITYLVKKVKEENIPVVLYIELSTGKTAKAIAEETGATEMQIQTLHNISKEDFNNGETYVSLMTRNLDVLKKALQ